MLGQLRDEAEGRVGTGRDWGMQDYVMARRRVARDQGHEPECT
jgi:hypothetical protein